MLVKHFNVAGHLVKAILRGTNQQAEQDWLLGLWRTVHDASADSVTLARLMFCRLLITVTRTFSALTQVLLPAHTRGQTNYGTDMRPGCRTRCSCRQPESLYR